MRRVAAVIAALVLNSWLLQAQDPISPSAPRTKLEAFEAQEGVVLVRGFSRIGEVRGVYGGLVSVQSVEVMNAATGKKEYGIEIDVRDATHSGLEDQSNIDYDEISSLIKGIDYISKAEKNATKLDGFQVDYQTKGDFAISFSNSGKKTACTVSSGRIGRVSVSFKLADLLRLRDLIKAAQAKLDEIRMP